MADKNFLAVGNVAGNINIYDVNSGVFTQLASPDIMPSISGSNLVYTVDFSNNGDYLVAACNLSPRVYIYKRQNNNYVKLPDPSVLPEGPANAARFSPDNNFLAVSHVAGSTLKIYERTGDTFNKLPDPSGASGVEIAEWSRGSDYLLTGSNFGSVGVFQRVSNVFSSIPTTGSHANPRSGAFSPVSDLLVITHESAPRVTVSTVTNGVYSRLPDPSVLPTSNARCVAFNPQGTLCAVGAGDGLFLYSVSGTTLTRLPNPSGSPTNIQGAAFNIDGTLLALSLSNSPYMAVYSVSGTTLTQVGNPPSLGNSSIFAVAFSNAISKLPNPSVITVDKSALIAMQNAVIYYNQNKPEGLTGGINFPNQPGWVTPENQPWSRLSIAPMVSTNVAVGGGANWVRRSMLIVIDVFTPKGSGVNTNLAICEEVINLFENTQFGNIKTFEANLAKIEDDPWLGYQVTINAYIEGY